MLNVIKAELLKYKRAYGLWSFMLICIIIYPLLILLSINWDYDLYLLENISSWIKFAMQSLFPIWIAVIAFMMTKIDNWKMTWLYSHNIRSKYFIAKVIVAILFIWISLLIFSLMMNYVLNIWLNNIADLITDKTIISDLKASLTRGYLLSFLTYIPLISIYIFLSNILGFFPIVIATGLSFWLILEKQLRDKWFGFVFDNWQITPHFYQTKMLNEITIMKFSDTLTISNILILIISIFITVWIWVFYYKKREIN
jgi:hypothetical protein